MSTPAKTRRQTPCPREGCPGKSFEGSDYCSYLCRSIAREMENTQSICEALGDSELTNELWTQIVAISDEYSRYLDTRFQLRKLALKSGIKPDQWELIRRGRVMNS